MEALLTFYKSKTITVEPLMFLYSIAKFMYIPIIEQYYYHYYGAAILKDTSFEFPKSSYCINSSLINYYTGSNDSYKRDETESNDIVIYTMLAGVPSVIIAILLGPLTDRFGRKLGLFIPCFGCFIEGLGSILIVYYRLNPYYFIGTNLITGLTGGYTGLSASCFSYIADVGSRKWRSFRIAAIEAMDAFGKVAGQLFSGYWLAAVHCNFIPLMILYTGIMAACLLYILFIPESRTAEERKILLKKTKGRFQKYSQAIKIYCTSISLNTYMLYVVTVVLGVAVLNMIGSFFLSVYFLKAIPFEFNSVQISYYQALRFGSQGLSNLLFFFFAILNINDSVIMLLAFLVNGSGNLLTGFATRTWEIYAISAVQGMENTIFSAARGLASKLLPPEQQGTLFGIIASVESLAAVVGSTVWSYIFPITLDHNMRPGTTFIIISAVGFSMVPVILSIIVIEAIHSRSHKDQVLIQAGGPKHSSDYSSRTTSVHVSDSDDERSQLLPNKSPHERNINV